MVAEELENAIRKFICETFEVEYISRMHISVEDNVYICKLDMNTSLTPIEIVGEFNSADAFFEFMKKELINRRLNIASYFKLQMESDTIYD